MVLISENKKYARQKKIETGLVLAHAPAGG